MISNQRTDQEHFLNNYQGGYAGLTAVPGAGKTTVLVRLFLQLVERGVSADKILVLSYTRAASRNFQERLLAEAPQLSRYRLDNICTIHACALRLIRSQLNRWGYSLEQTTTISALQKRDLLEGLVHQWLIGREAQWQQFLLPKVKPEQIQQWRLKLVDLAEQGISLAKQGRISPADLEKSNFAFQQQRFFLALISGVFQSYQKQLKELNLLDFDDLVYLAIKLLEEDCVLREYWQKHYRYLLEDEAQDSSPAQCKLLELLAGAKGNWVRVGDPNQAIFSSFTASSHQFLREFCQQNQHFQLEQSGRSVKPIVQLANNFVTAVMGQHPHPPAQSSFLSQQIQPAYNSPEPHAQSEPRFWSREEREEEIQEVIRRSKRYLTTYPDHSVGILAFANKYLDDFNRRLSAQNIPFIDLRNSPGGALLDNLQILLQWVVNPLKKKHFQDAVQKIGRFEKGPIISGLISQVDPVQFLDGVWTWRTLPGWSKLSENDQIELIQVEEKLRFYYQKRIELLPEFLLRTSKLFGEDPGWISTTEQLARSIAISGYAKTTEEFLDFLESKKGQRWREKMVPIEEEILEEEKGLIELCTLHSAKGREWDAVFIPGITPYWFPTDYNDPFQGELDFLTVYPEALLKTEILGAADSKTPELIMKDQIIQERLRLVYVGITRARHYLSLSTFGNPSSVFTWFSEGVWF
ncbi:MAG: ATP-dependent helicase [Gloeobacterales cyanobacterium]